MTLQFLQSFYCFLRTYFTLFKRSQNLFSLFYYLFIIMLVNTISQSKNNFIQFISDRWIRYTQFFFHILDITPALNKHLNKVQLFAFKTGKPVCFKLSFYLSPTTRTLKSFYY